MQLQDTADAGQVEAVGGQRADLCEPVDVPAAVTAGGPRAAARGGHEVWYVGVGDVEHGPGSDQLMARAHAAELDEDDTLASFMERARERDAERVVLDDLDALFLRNESLEDLPERPWAIPLGAIFGEMLEARGVTVVNDPSVLVRATSKLYLEEFPEKVRPRSLVTRDPEAIEAFLSSARATPRSLAEASGSSRMAATFSRCDVRYRNETSRNASRASAVNASGATLRRTCPSKVAVETRSELRCRYRVVSGPSVNGSW